MLPRCSGWPRPHEWGLRPSQNGSFQGPKWVIFDPSEGPICGKSASNGSRIRSIWGPRPLDPGIQTLKDTVKRSKGDSIDGQIMLFPITRAREGIYKDPGYPGSWDRPRTPFGVLRESHLARFNGRSRGFGLQLGPRMVPEWVQNRSFQGLETPDPEDLRGPRSQFKGELTNWTPKWVPQIANLTSGGPFQGRAHSEGSQNGPLRRTPFGALRQSHPDR